MMATTSQSEGFNELHEIIDWNAKHIIEYTRKRIDEEIERLQKHDEYNAMLTRLTDLDFDNDIHQTTPNLNEYLQKRTTDVHRNQSELPKLQVKLLLRHYMFNPNAPNPQFDQTTVHFEQSLYMNDFENWVLYSMKIDSFAVNYIRNLCDRYANLAEKLYSGDQVNMSRMILVRIKMIKILDMIACNAHPLLTQHRTDINPKLIDLLLLPQKRDMDCI